jgi:Spy/CpxP family protein refolding chaperone
MKITGIRSNLGLMGRGFATLGVAALLAAGTALAQGPGGDFGMGPHQPPMERAMGPRGDHGRWWNEPRIAERYKITDAQRKSMDEIYQQHRLTLVDLHATLEKAELALEPLVSEDQPDEGKVLQQIDRVAQARAELEKANARMLLDIRKTLTPDQWKQIRTDRSEHRFGPGEGRPGERMQRRWGNSDGGGHAAPNGPPPPGGAPAGPGEDR